MSKTLKELADLVGGKVVGDEKTVIERVSGMEEAEAGAITFLSNPKYIRLIPHTRASAIIVPPQITQAPAALLVCENPYLAFARIVEHMMYNPPQLPKGVDPASRVSASAQLGRDVVVMPFAYVGDNARIGDGTVIYPSAYVGAECAIGAECIIGPNAVIYEGTLLGDRCVVHANVTLGSSGFGFAPDGARWYKIRQVGRTVLGDDVEIGANTTIDRAAMGETVVGRGSKIGSHVMIAHNCRIGEDTILVGKIGVAGTARIGNHCTIAGNVAVSGHLSIGDEAKIGGSAAVNRSLEGNREYLGAPAIPARKALKCYLLWTKLPEMHARIRAVEKQLGLDRHDKDAQDAEG